MFYYFLCLNLTQYYVLISLIIVNPFDLIMFWKYSYESNLNFIYVCFLVFHLFEKCFQFILCLFFLGRLCLGLIIKGCFCFFCCSFAILRLRSRCLGSFGQGFVLFFYLFLIRLVELFLAAAGGLFVLCFSMNLFIMIVITYFFGKKLFVFFLCLLLINLKNLKLLKT